MKKNVIVTIAVLVIAIAIIAAGFYWLVFMNDDERGTLTVTFIDTGQGDSILIQTPDAKNILIDAGGNLGPQSIVSCLSSNNVTIIDALIITHPHADHLNYSDEVLNNFDVLSIYHTGMIGYSPSFIDFIGSAEEEGCQIYSDDDIGEGDLLPLSDEVTFKVLNIDSNADSVNAASIVIKMSYSDVDFLFMGDAQSDVEYDLIAEYGDDLDCEVLKVGHHGSSDSTSSSFLSETSPEIGIICVGENDYGHPHSATLDRLYSHGVDVYGTEIDGTIVVSTDGSHIDIDH